MDPDLLLIHRAQAGDVRAGDLLARRYLPLLFQWFSKRCQDLEAVADLTQETLLAGIAKIRLFRRECAFRSYLFCIAHRCLFEHFRRAQRKPRPIPWEGLPEPGYDTSLDSLDLPRVYQVLATLPQHYRIAVELALGGFTPQEAAEEMGVPYHTSRSRLSRGLALTRAHFAEGTNEKSPLSGQTEG